MLNSVAGHVISYSTSYIALTCQGKSSPSHKFADAAFSQHLHNLDKVSQDMISAGTAAGNLGSPRKHI